MRGIFQGGFFGDLQFNSIISLGYSWILELYPVSSSLLSTENPHSLCCVNVLLKHWNPNPATGCVWLGISCRSPQNKIHPSHGGANPGGDPGPRAWAQESNNSHFFWHDAVWVQLQWEQEFPHGKGCKIEAINRIISSIEILNTI